MPAPEDFSTPQNRHEGTSHGFDDDNGPICHAAAVCDAGTRAIGRFNTRPKA
jgi:hypothetical protein